MGSKGSTQQVVNQTAQYTPSPQITAAGQQALQGGQAAAQQPFWLPQQPVAPFSPDQLAAFQNVRNIQGMTAPWFGQAGNLAQMSATPLTADQIANFYNPMAQNVTNQLQNIYGQQMRDVTGKLTQAAGGVGADRIAVGQAQLANQQGLASGQIYSQLYQQALNAAMQNQQMQGQAAFALGNLGQGAQGAALQGSQALLGVGGLQQQLAQANLMAPYAWLGQQFAYPYQANQYLAGITGALVPAFPSTTTGQSQTTTTPPQPSPISQGIGLGMAGMGMMQGKGGGYNPGTIGGTNPFTGSASAIYRHGGRVHRQMGGQAGSGFGSISPFTSSAQVPGPGIPPPAIQAISNVQRSFDPASVQQAITQAPQFPGSLGITEALQARQQQAAAAPQSGAQPQQGFMQQAMQSHQMQQLFQRYPWLQGLLQSAPQGQVPAFAQSQMGRMQNPSFGTGSKGGFAWPGRGFADGGATKAPAIPQMTAGTASDMDAYFANINKQAQDLSAMSRFAMQPTGGGWTRSSFGQPAQQPESTQPTTTGGDLSTFFNDPLSAKILQSPFDQTTGKPNPGFAAGGASDTTGGIGDDPFGSTDSFVPNVHLAMSNFHGPDLPKVSAPSGGSSSGKGSTASDIGTAANVAMQVLPMLMVARGGAVGPFSHYQHFQEGGGDDMTDIGTFPFTPADASPVPPSPEDLRPPVPTPFAGLGDTISADLEGLRPTRGEFATPQEAEQARAAKELFAKQVAGTPEPVPGTPPTEQPVASPFLPKPTRNMTYETAGAAAPTPAPSSSPFGGLPALAEVPIPQEPGRAPITPVQQGNLPASPFNLPVQQPPTGQGNLFQDEKQRQAMSVGMPQEGVPMPQPRPDLTQAPMPLPRPDIAGPPGQAFRSPFAPQAYPTAGGIAAPDQTSRRAGDIQQIIANEWGKRGMSPAGIAGIHMNVGDESGFNPSLRHPDQPRWGGEAHFAHGLYQEGGAEWNRYQGWLQQNAPGADWRDPRLQSAFAAENLQRNYPQVWQQMQNARTPGEAAVAYMQGYLKPAQQYQEARAQKYLGSGDTTQLSAKGLAGGPPQGPTGAPLGQVTGASQYQLPAGQMPFPQAGAQAPGADIARNPWVMAGLNIAGGTSPWAAVNIGRGAASALEKQREQAEKEVSVNQKAQDLWLQMQKHTDAMTKLSAAQQLEALKPFRYGTDLDTGVELYAIRDPTNGNLVDTQTGRIIQRSGAIPTVGPIGGVSSTASSEARDAAIEKYTQQDEEAQKQYAAPEVTPNLIPEKQPGAAMLKGPFASAEAQTIRAYNDNINKKVRPALDFQREQINRLKLDYATIMRDEGEGFFARMMQLPGNPSPEGRLAAMRLANNTAIANRQQPPFDPAKIAAMEEVQKIQATMGMSFAATISPRDSQQMQMAAIQAQPGMTQSPQGFQRLIGLYDGATARGEDRLKFWNRWQQVNPHRFAGFDDDFATKNPPLAHTVRSLIDNSPYPQARQRLPEAIKYLREHKDDAAYRARFDKVYGGTSNYFLTGTFDTLGGL